MATVFYKLDEDVVALVSIFEFFLQVVSLIVLSFIHKRVRLFREFLWGYPGIVMYVVKLL